MLSFNWNQIACLHIAFYFVFKLCLFLSFCFNAQEQPHHQSNDFKGNNKVVDSNFQRFTTQGFMVLLVTVSYLGYLGKLDWAVVYPVDDRIARIGSVVAALATLTMMWTHLYLGKSWSGVVSKQVDQKLVTSGPYAFARHPMYAFGYLQPLGLWLLTNNWLMGGLWAFQKAFVTRRMGREDMLMVELFGEEYANYHKTTGAILPFKPFGWDLGLSEAEVQAALKNRNKKST